MMMERLKSRAYREQHANPYFWRTWDQAEIDLVEERDGRLHGYEFKWAEQPVTVPKDFIEAYPDSEFRTVHRGNWAEDFALGGAGRCSVAPEELPHEYRSRRADVE
jgi:hypothetical protein